jgi:hypothetical protein
MTARRILRPLAVLAGAMLVLAACGSGASTGAPTSGPAATTAAVATPTAVATVVLPASSPEASFDLPSGDEDLEEQLPDELGGQTLTKLSMTGDQFMGAGQGAEELTSVLTALGKQPSDLSVAFAGTDKITVIAYRIKGVPGGQVLSGLINAYEDAQNATVTDVTIGGKPVKKFVAPDPSAAEDGTVYIYTAGDTVFIVGGENVTDELLNEAFSKLP